ncbi:TIGR04086 family membrane protein [Arthrobacter sp. PsM3]|uniref:TIGR04086 family membrane protein n=1 Tax=Arthrobacter sp. PsM3 TaxID=3030531 RepID=UPI00263BC14C|nr:YrzE family protein [Arthrobacter sp. PsM3]MDN4645801.1 YrzE family protein [Arthrobacter sp. PsM3]
MSNPAGPEDHTPRRARDEDGAVSQDARIHDARQDAARPGTAAANDTSALPTGAAADAPTRAQDVVHTEPVRTEPTRSQPVTAVRHDEPPLVTAPRDTVVEEIPTRETVVAREKEQFGGIQIGSAFFGWLAATGLAVLLTALVAAAGTAVGLATNTDVNATVTSGNESVGLVGIIVLLVILFVSYFAGGYVAGRMARFNGAKQGFMVWIWALIAAVVVAILGLVAGQKYNILAQLNSFPRIPVNEGQLTSTSIIAAVVVAAVALVGAVIGGTAGMHFHRKVDRAGFAPVDTVEER